MKISINLNIPIETAAGEVIPYKGQTTIDSYVAKALTEMHSKFTPQKAWSLGKKLAKHQSIELDEKEFEEFREYIKNMSSDVFPPFIKAPILDILDAEVF